MALSEPGDACSLQLRTTWERSFSVEVETLQ